MGLCVCVCVLTGVPSCQMGLHKAGKPWGHGEDSELWGQVTWRAPLPATGLGRAPGTCISPVKGLRQARGTSSSVPEAVPPQLGLHLLRVPGLPQVRAILWGHGRDCLPLNAQKKLSLPENTARWTEVHGIRRMPWEGRTHKSSEEN